MTASSLAAENPFSRAWILPYGLPDFVAVRTEHIRPALDVGLAQQRAEWAAIATDPAAPTVANTLDAVERSGQLLQRVEAVFGTLVSSAGTDELREIESEYAPVLAAHQDAFWLDERLYDRLEEVQASGVDDPETAWVLHRYLTGFIRAGIRLGENEKAILRGLNGEITTLETQFAQQVVAGLESAAVHLTDPELLAGLAEDAVSALAQAATDRGLDGHLVTLDLPTDQAIVSQAADRRLREQVFTASATRGTGVHPHSDTRATLVALAGKRAERAQLLGYAHHGAYVAEDGTAKSTEAINAMLARLAGPAVRNARAEGAELAEALAADEPGAQLAAWDWPYYADRVRRERYAVDDAALRPYLELDRVIHDGVFYAAGRLYGLTFTENKDLAGYAEGVRVWEVFDHDGTGLGLFVGDYYAREGKRGGAWMHNLVDASGLLGHAPVVVNNLNIARPADGQPTLLTWDEVITAFHEFGHALHGLFAECRYPSVSGTNVPRDFVEYPSQVNEMWAWHPEVLASFARHHRTGESLPADTVEKLRTSQAYGQGFGTTEYLAAAMLDQAWHQLTPEQVPTRAEAVTGFESDALAAIGLDYPLVPPRYRSTYFNHIFGGGYDAGYYSYIWSEVLDADTVEWFRQEAAQNDDGGLNRAAGRRFRAALLARGHTRDPLASYRDLRGRDAVIDPLLKRLGLDS
ncbi:M3 family metallopeptidase [Ruania zhangjianzhongii]|uniref:M3 family metallopeptidase n=1 Tax=Ruania zhangjianzhongii TaxID=2603206 RepID=UPI0011CAD848|nr:M3 family metallopeptidase [Ruania zhangjianzhongii]